MRNISCFEDNRVNMFYGLELTLSFLQLYNIFCVVSGLHDNTHQLINQHRQILVF